MQSEYPYIQCLNPQFVYNKYIGEYILVECGCCHACLMRKASRNKLKCQLESMNHKYNMFATLTYNQLNLPLMDTCCNRVDDYLSAMVELCPRLGVGTILGKCDLPPYEDRKLRIKCNTFNLFPHLSKRDVQLFMKRLRKYIKKYSDEKIRYYVVGEYGPIHFRPHYHLMLWYSCDKIHAVIQQAISACWKLGRIDAQQSRGNAAQYVAQYVSCNSILPRIFMQSETKPFVLHSHHLGESVLEKEKEEVYALSAREFNERSINFGKGDRKFTLWRTLKTFFFPKCKGYAFLTDEQLYYIYRIALETRRWTGKANLAAQARYIIRYIKGVYRLFGSYEQRHQDPDINDMLLYFEKSCGINPLHEYCDDIYFQRVYAELRLSNHFLNFVCDGDYSPEKSKKMIKRIKQYWNECEYDNLISQLEAQETLDFEDEEEFQYFYHNINWSKSIEKSKKYNTFKSSSYQRFEDSIKHKKLNDLNKIFVY